MTLLLYCYNPAPEYDERRKESEEWLQKVEHYVRVVRQPCTQPRDYPNKIKQAWGKENLIILEQDVVPPPMPPVLTLQDMLIFIQEYELVAWRYLLYPLSTNLVNPVYAHRVWSDNDVGRRLRWISRTDFKADYVGLGFSGISLRVQKMIPSEIFDKIPTWRDVDTCLSEQTQKLGMQWYVPAMECKHNHK